MLRELLTCCLLLSGAPVALAQSEAPPPRPVQEVAEEGARLGKEMVSEHWLPTIKEDVGGHTTFEIQGREVLLDHISAGGSQEETNRLKRLAAESDLEDLERAGYEAFERSATDPSLQGQAVRSAVSSRRLSESQALGESYSEFLATSLQAIEQGASGVVGEVYADCRAQVEVHDAGTPLIGHTRTMETCETLHYPAGCTMERELRLARDQDLVLFHTTDSLTQTESLPFSATPPEGVLLEADFELTFSGSAGGAEITLMPSAANNWRGMVTLRVNDSTCQPDNCPPQTARVTVLATLVAVRAENLTPECQPVSDSFCSTTYQCQSVLPDSVDGYALTEAQRLGFGALYPGDGQACARAAAAFDCPFNAGEVCWDGPMGRVCDRVDPSRSNPDSCSGLRARAECAAVDSRCAEGGAGESGWCYVRSHTFECRQQVAANDLRVVTTFPCNSNLLGAGSAYTPEEVFNEQREQSLAKTQARLVAMNHTMSDWRIEERALVEDRNNPRQLRPMGEASQKSGGVILPPGVRVFGGDPMECRKALGGTIDCCTTTQSEANSLYWDLYGEHSRQQSARSKLGGEGAGQGSWSAMLSPQGLTNSDLNGAFVSAAEGAQGDSSKAIGADGSHAGVGHSPWLRDMQQPLTERAREEIAPDLGWACSTQEFDLAVKKEMGLCTKVGSYCASSTLGICTDKRDSYCCFASPYARMARVSLAGGEPAILNGALGKASSPHCSGVPIDVAAEAGYQEDQIEELAAYMVKGGAVPTSYEAMVAKTSPARLSGSSSRLGQDDRKDSGQRAQQRLAQISGDGVRGALVADAESKALSAPLDADGGPEVSFNVGFVPGEPGRTVHLRVSRRGSQGVAKALVKLRTSVNLHFAGLDFDEVALEWPHGDTSDRLVRFEVPERTETVDSSRAGRFEFDLVAGAGTRLWSLKEAWVELSARPRDEIEDPGQGCQLTKEEIADAQQRGLFQPEGYELVERTWDEVFGMGYPSDGGLGSPVGSWSIDGRRYTPGTPMRGRYLSIPIVGDGNSYNLSWIGAVPKPEIGYTPRRDSEFALVTISPCKGDFRQPGALQYTSPDPVRDPTFMTWCRTFAPAESGLSYGPSYRSPRLCPVEPGKRYFINIAYADPRDGLSPHETECKTADAACEMHYRHKVTDYSTARPAQMSKAAVGVTPVSAGMVDVTWELRLRNTTGQPIAGGQIIDRLPADHSFVRAEGATGAGLDGACGTTTIHPPSGGSGARELWTCSGLPAIPPDGEWAVRVVTRGPEGWPAVNSCRAELTLVNGETTYVTDALCNASVFEPVDDCRVDKRQLEGRDRALFQPDGFTGVEVPWSRAFPGYAFPRAFGRPYPLGSWSMTDPDAPHGSRYGASPPMAGRYLAIPITGINIPVAFQWITAHPFVSHGYAPIRQADNITVTFSTCKGDFRVRDRWEDVAPSPDPVNDPTFVKACRVVGHSETGVYFAPSGRCPMVPGRRYYLNILFDDAEQNLPSPSRTTCRPGRNNVCEASFTAM
jgi:conjugal transfer mating pair stabilization protein TraN